MKVSENTSVDMPLKNLISIIGAVAIGVWAYFGIIERLNTLETDNHLIKKDLEGAVEFSIKWPRGELGSLPADSEQFLLIEDAIKDIEDIQEEQKESRHNATNISRLQKDVERLNHIETNGKLMITDVDKNTEFRIKWPRGEMGSLPADSEQFLLIESILTDVEDMQVEIKESRHNATNITRLQKDVDRLLEEIEKLKDKVRANGSSH